MPQRDAGTNADCCYVVPTIGCYGRPLEHQGEDILAAVVSRADWARSA